MPRERPKEIAKKKKKRKNCEEFYSKKEKNRFSVRKQDWDKRAFFFVGILVIKAGARRSRSDHDGGLLGNCLE